MAGDSVSPTDNYVRESAFVEAIHGARSGDYGAGLHRARSPLGAIGVAKCKLSEGVCLAVGVDGIQSAK